MVKKFIVPYRGIDYEVNAGLRATFIYEEIAGKAFEPKSTLDMIVYAYSIMWTAENFSDKWDDFIEYIEENSDFVGDLFNRIPRLPGKEKAPAAENLPGTGNAQK